MARRGDGIFLRGETWYLDCLINGVRHQKRLGKGLAGAPRWNYRGSRAAQS